MPTFPPYLAQQFVHRQLLPAEVKHCLPVRQGALVLLAPDGLAHTYLEAGKAYRLEALQEAAAEGRLYLVHAVRWAYLNELAPAGHPDPNQPTPEPCG